jgi:hypothetical protein
LPVNPYWRVRIFRRDTSKRAFVVPVSGSSLF